MQYFSKCHRIAVNTECKQAKSEHKLRLSKEIDDHIQSELNHLAKLKKAEISKEVIFISKILINLI